ncbi:MAG: glycosyltransferase [Thermodesulfobacteriota bacterium]
MSRRVYILLPVHNRREITQRFVDCLKIQTYQNFHLVLLDDGSADGTEAMTRALLDPGKLTVIRGEGNWWWAGSLQQGINWLRRLRPDPSDIILMINDDVVFQEDFLERALAEVQQRRKTLLLARALDESTGIISETGVHADFRYMSFTAADSPENINCLSTRGLFLRWDSLEDIGGFYPRLLPHYGSDYEFTMRALRKGYHLLTDPDVYLIPNPVTTGVRNIAEDTDVQGVLKTLFAKKSVMNPIYLTAFVFLAFPVRWIPLNLFKIWARAGRNIFKSIKGQTRK